MTAGLEGGGSPGEGVYRLNHWATAHKYITTVWLWQGHFNHVRSDSFIHEKLCGRPPQYASAPCKLTFDLLTLKVVSESRVTWATSVPSLLFLGLSVLDLGPMCATDIRQTTSDVRRASSLNNNTITIDAEFCTGAVMRILSRFPTSMEMKSSHSTIGTGWSVYSTGKYSGNGNSFAAIAMGAVCLSVRPDDNFTR